MRQSRSARRKSLQGGQTIDKYKKLSEIASELIMTKCDCCAGNRTSYKEVLSRIYEKYEWLEVIPYPVSKGLFRRLSILHNRQIKCAMKEVLECRKCKGKGTI